MAKKRILSFLTVLAMLLSLSVSAWAADAPSGTRAAGSAPSILLDDDPSTDPSADPAPTPNPDPTPTPDPEPEPQPEPEPEPQPEPEPTPAHDLVSICLDPASLTMEVSSQETVSVNFVTGNAGSVSTYDWESTGSAVSVSGAGSSATVTATAAGTSTVTVVAHYSDGEEAARARCNISVSAASTPIQVSGGGNVTVKAGETKPVTATVSGGSHGSYRFEWSDEGEVAARDTMRQNAMIYGLSAGTGTVTLVVYDEDDASNYDSVTWNVTVESSSTPLTATIRPSSLKIGVGETGTLTVDASGGSGNNSNYTYNWYSASSKVSVTGNGATATVLATSSGSTTVSVDVYDTVTRTTKTADATVTVEGGSASYNASGSATVGANYPLSTIVGNIASEFQRQFGSTASSSAVIQFASSSGSTGVLRAQNGNQIRNNESISYSSVQAVYFQPTAAGTFSTAYTFREGGNTLSGTLTITSSGGAAVTGLTISNSSMDMATYSSRYLNVSVAPSNAAYSIEWATSDSRIAYVSGSGTSVTVYTQGYTGSATITATVTGSNGGRYSRTCSVYVSSSRSYNPTLTVTIGSDYYGTSISDSVAKQFRNVYGYNLDYNRATLRFSSTGNSRYGVMRQGNGNAIRANMNYTFQEGVDMYFEALSSGTFSLPYTLDYKGDQLTGTIEIYIRGSNVSVSINKSNLSLATYSNDTIGLTVTPSNVYYTVTWRSSNSSIVSVSGNGVTATVTSGGVMGSTTVTATVTDRNGVEVIRTCTVSVTNRSNTYNPSVSTTIGVPYRGTGTADALRAQYRSIYGSALPDSAIVRFSAPGDNNIAVLRLANGTPVKTNTNYSMAEFAAMYSDTVSVGTFSMPYTLTYGSNSMNGTCSLYVKAGAVTASIALDNTQAYTFNNAASGGATGSSMLATSITNGLGGSWDYLRFGTSTSSVGTLYLDPSRASLGGKDVSQSALGSLYFVPNYGGDYSIPFTVHNRTGSNLGSGTLYIRVNASNVMPATTQFGDVKDSDWFALGVNWAVSRGITNGMGKKNGVEMFQPNATCNTAQILTFLWRSQGSPLPTISNPFTDVKSSDYFYNAALWAFEKGLVSGTYFGEKTACTRAAVVTYMWKLAGRPGAQPSSFVDVTSGSETASAVDWALSKNITGGIGNDASGRPMFGPSMTCTRGQIVTFLYRAYA